MCLLCDGYAESEMAARLAREVQARGWTRIGVESDPPWIYTIGLRWTFDHPELIVVHPDPDKARDAMEHAVDEIESGRTLRIGSTVTLPRGGGVRIGAVHAKNLTGEWFARWPWVAKAAGRQRTSLRALQLIFECACSDCSSQICLDECCGPSSNRTVGRRRSR